MIALEHMRLLCYHRDMRQQFDVGDIVEYINLKGFVIESQPIIKFNSSPGRKLHLDEYRCKVQFFGSEEPRWIRAKWLKHISKISQ